MRRCAAILDDLPNTTAEFKQKFAYVPDELLLPDALSAAEYLDFVSSMYHCTSNEKRKQLIELFDMKEALQEPIETYSHGMKKKTQLIAAFMLESEFVIMDEPFRGLDIEAVINTKKLMKRYAATQGSILLATHDMLSAEELCDKIAILSKGVKMDEGKVKELKAKYNSDSLEEVFLKGECRQADGDLQRGTVLHARSADDRYCTGLRPYYIGDRSGDDRLVRNGHALLCDAEGAFGTAEQR